MQGELSYYSKVKDLEIVKENLSTKTDLNQFEELYNYVNDQVYKNDQASEFAEVMDVKFEEISEILSKKCNQNDFQKETKKLSKEILHNYG